MNPRLCQTIPPYMRDGACAIADAGRDKKIKPDLSRPSIFTSTSKPPKTVTEKEIKHYTQGVSIP